MTWEVRQADCIEAMRELDEASVDAICTDPPYGIGFMGKAWDGAAIEEAARQDAERRKALGPHSDGRPGRAQPRSSTAFGNAAGEAGAYDFTPKGLLAFQAWCLEWATEALRILKPGGHLLAFGGTRTYHRLACAVEDAGFEIRDSLIWLYGSGFPKSHDVGKAIDRAAGAEREILETIPDRWAGKGEVLQRATQAERDEAYITAPATPEAQRWQGWGTALKPAHEPIVVARKPLAGTVAANVSEYGTGALNIDATRIGAGGHLRWAEPRDMGYHGGTDNGSVSAEESALGRWPANCVLTHLPECDADVGGGPKPAPRGNATSQSVGAGDASAADVSACAPGCPVAELDRQSGQVGANGGSGEFRQHAWMGGDTPQDIERSKGNASRFFYTAKASRAERNAGLDDFPERESGKMEDDAYEWAVDGRGNPRAGKTQARNVHPTVKPIDLMRWLVRLGTPPDGLVLDPFTGSGTTGIAAVLEGFDFIGIEREDEYAEIARARIAWWAKAPRGAKTQMALKLDKGERKDRDAGQASLLDLSAPEPCDWCDEPHQRTYDHPEEGSHVVIRACAQHDSFARNAARAA